jgi:hypothetical protein
MAATRISFASSHGVIFSMIFARTPLAQRIGAAVAKAQFPPNPRPSNAPLGVMLAIVV